MLIGSTQDGPNIELSCAAESPTRSEPLQRHAFEKEDHLRRQLQRFVRQPERGSWLRRRFYQRCLLDEILLDIQVASTVYRWPAFRPARAGLWVRAHSPLLLFCPAKYRKNAVLVETIDIPEPAFA